jgi:hypothetical protein
MCTLIQGQPFGIPLFTLINYVKHDVELSLMLTAAKQLMCILMRDTTA